jgi:PilZ domain
MVERRIPSRRRRVLKGGTIVFNSGGATISATIKNISESGALLEVESIMGIPDRFTLFIKANDFKRECRIVWSQAKRIGVRFL